MLTARAPRRVRDLRAFLGSGWRAVDEEGEPGLRVCRSAGMGSSRSRAKTSGSRLWPGGSRRVRWRAWRISPPGTAISRQRRVAIMALPPRTPCPARMSCPAVMAVELVQPGGHARGEQRTPRRRSRRRSSVVAARAVARRSNRPRRRARHRPEARAARAGRPAPGAAGPARSRAGHRSRRPGRRPAPPRPRPRPPRAAGHPLALMVIRHPALLPAVGVHIRGVQVDGDRAVAHGQRRGPLRRQHVQHPPGHRRQATLHRCPLGRGDPPGQARRGRGCQPGHRGDLWPAASARGPAGPRPAGSPPRPAAPPDPGQQLPER